jgi:hypothetical protein
MRDFKIYLTVKRHEDSNSSLFKCLNQHVTCDNKKWI